MGGKKESRALRRDLQSGLQSSKDELQMGADGVAFTGVGGQVALSEWNGWAGKEGPGLREPKVAQSPEQVTW